MIKISILVDNISNDTLLCEHGLSIIAEKTDGSTTKRIIVDFGASCRYRENAAMMGILLSSLDYAIVSHGHYDHIGGMKDFIENCGDTTIYLSKEIISHKYYSSRHGNVIRNIGECEKIISDHSERIIQINENSFISNDIALVFNKHNEYHKPKANKYLFSESDSNKEIVSDNFTHEMSVAIVDNGALVIISPCSHNGIINIINSCIDFTGIKSVKAFIGGLHLVDDAESETKEEIENLGKSINSLFPNMTVYTGHCTGEKAFETLKNQAISNKIENLFSGKTFTID